jgi:hypothetical protein
MTVPGYAAEASLYRTNRSYRGVRRGPAAAAGQTVVAQQLIACNDKCAIELGLCEFLCALSAEAPVVTVACVLSCWVLFGLCLDDCPPDTAPVGGGGTPPECGVGRRCCERDESGRCTICVPNNANCP